VIHIVDDVGGKLFLCYFYLSSFPFKLSLPYFLLFAFFASGQFLYLISDSQFRLVFVTSG
jgi:hypothetical protein